MKRSEMIKLVEKAAYDNYLCVQRFGDHVDASHLAEDFLTLFEEAGMKPPLTVKLEPKAVTNYYFDLRDLRWEKEST